MEYVLATDVVQRDDVPWERCVARVGLRERQPDVDDYNGLEGNPS